MEVILYDEKGLDAPLIHDIIGENVNEGDNLMLQYTNKGIVVLYATIKDITFLKLSKNEPISESIGFYEYKTTTSKKGYINILARVNIQNIFDLLNPYSQRQLLNYRDECIKNNISFKNEQDLITTYMKTHKLQILRYCEPINSCLGTSYILKYKVFDEKCILSCESVK